jgi:hypothetical protein
MLSSGQTLGVFARHQWIDDFGEKRMAWHRVVIAAFLTFGLLHATAQADDDDDEIFGDLQACLGGMGEDEAEALFDDLAARHEVLAAAHDIEARLETLCTAGDRHGAEALWATYEAELYAGPDAMLARQCLEAQIEAMRAHLAAVGMDVGDKPHVCDGEF